MSALLRSQCFSCKAPLLGVMHKETYDYCNTDRAIPLCDHCIDHPASMNMERIIWAVLSLEDSDFHEKNILLKTMVHNRTDRYQNLVGVVVCLVLLDYRRGEWFDLLLVHRKDQPEGANRRSLLAGFMEQRHGSGLKSGAIEIFEEADIKVSPDDIEPFTWDTNPRNTLTLNAVVVNPQGLIQINEFQEDNEVSAREIFRVTPNSVPELCFPIHQQFLHRLHQECFAGAKPPYLPW